MDKKMINIDDLMRSRLGGAEEREPAGAWGSMKDLLDKQMPVQPAAAVNWRRMLGYATGLLVVASLSVGGYKMVNSDSGFLSASLNKSAATKESAAVKANTPAATSQSPIAANTNTTNGHPNTIAATGNSGLPREHQAVAELNNTTSGSGNHLSTAATTSTSNNTNTTNRHTTARPGNHNSQNSNNNHSNVATDPEAIAGNTTTAAQTKTVAMNTGVEESVPVDRAGRVSNATSAAVTTPTVNNATTTEAVKPVSRTRNNNSGSLANARSRRGNGTTMPRNNNAGSSRNRNNRNTTIPAEMIIPASASGSQMNTGSSTTAALTNPALKRIDSVKQIELMYRLVYNPETDKKIYQIDTLGYRKIAVERDVVQVAANDRAETKAIEEKQTAQKEEPVRKPQQTEIPSLAKNEKTAMTETAPAIMPAAGMLTAEAIDNNNLVSLSKFRVSTSRSSKFRRMWEANTERLNAFVQNVNIAIDKAQCYGGITGGFNSTVFSTNTLAGFQLGLTGMLAFNERWSLVADLKYFHRFNTASIGDNYLRVSNIVPGNESVVNGVTYREYTWDQENVIHYYNLTAVQTVELPVTLRRNIGRIFGEAGLNMMYSFPVNTEEVERSQGNIMTVTRSFPMNQSPGESVGGGKHVTLQDFNSRFGLGYVLGAGYEFTPALNANVRLVQNFWDNAVSPGAAKVSRNLFQTPSVQFSIGYRFSQGKKH